MYFSFKGIKMCPVFLFTVLPEINDYYIINIFNLLCLIMCIFFSIYLLCVVSHIRAKIPPKPSYPSFWRSHHQISAPIFSVPRSPCQRHISDKGRCPFMDQFFLSSFDNLTQFDTTSTINCCLWLLLKM